MVCHLCKCLFTFAIAIEFCGFPSDVYCGFFILVHVFLLHENGNCFMGGFYLQILYLGGVEMLENERNQCI